MLIFIVGYMGAGKTTLGRQLAGKLQYRFYDLDEVIESNTGYRIADYFEKFGEPAFRKKERELLLGFLEAKDTVIATGGGTPCYFDNMDRMNHSGITICLEAEVEEILQRLSGKIEKLPLLKNIPADQIPSFISSHRKSRQEFYNRSTIRISSSPPDLDGLVKILHNFAGHKPIPNHE